ncbi:MAG: response regulator transcription factor [Cyanobacteria bacterium]|nr:response regulator transcription factor [Cyanobacteriota bacterium]
MKKAHRMARILIVEDEQHLAESMRGWLILEGHHVDVCMGGDLAARMLAAQLYDVIILDILLPGINGIELCKRYREHGGTARILVASAKGTSADKLRGLDAGADDYISKPFDLMELSARVRALMRRSVSMIGNQIVVSDLIMDLSTHQVQRAGRDVKLLPQEFSLLEFLARQPNKLFSAEVLIERLWHGKASIDTLRTHIKTLRKKIDVPGAQPMIKTVHGVGYALNVSEGENGATN